MFAICYFFENRRWVPTGAEFDTYDQALAQLLALEKLTRKRFTVIHQIGDRRWEFIKKVA